MLSDKILHKLSLAHVQLPEKIAAPASPQARPAAPPSRVDEYQIICPLGSGAMGQVYQALDTVLGRPVAIKFLASESSTEQARERFLIEARAIARVQSPHVLSIYRVGVIGGRPYLAEEFLRGKSLDRMPLPLAWPKALNIAVQLARGLAAAHRQGVLHRDIKPANAMLTEDGTAKLLDFGLAKLNNTLEENYASAERLEVGFRSAPALSATPPAETVDAPGDSAWPSAGAPSAPQVLGPSRASASFARSQTLPGSGDDQPAAVVSGEHAAKSLTLAGAILGTPVYMAPEAWRSEPASAATDVYSLGALIYELCAGHPPHDFKTQQEIYDAATTQNARPLAELVPGINPKFAAIVDRCLRRSPILRFPSGEELQKELEVLATELAAPTARSVLRQAIRKRWLVALCLTTGLLVPPLAALRYLYGQRVEQHQAAALLHSRRSVAVVGLANPTRQPQYAGFASAFTELLGTELVVGERLRRILPESVARMKIDLGIPETASFGPELLLQIRESLSADLIVSGSILPETAGHDRLLVRISVTDTQTGTQLAGTVVSGSSGELFKLVTAAGSVLRQQLGLGELSEPQATALRAVRPTRPEVAQTYAQGRELLRRFDAVGARKLLEKVIAADPDYSLGHFAMAEMWTALGYDEKAKAEARRALEISSHLPREDRYLIEARYREASKDWDKAISAYQTLLTFFPDSLEYGLYLANAQLASGQAALALETARRLHQLGPSADQDPRLAILEARATSDAGDPQAAYTLLGRAVRQGEAIRAPLLVARAQLEAAYTLEYLGQHTRSLQSAAVAKQLFLTAGDRSAAADALMVTGAAYMNQGDLAQSLKAAQEAMDFLLGTENSALTATTLCNMALLLIKQGNLELARSRAEGGLALAREIGLRETQGTAMIALGWNELLRGNMENAGHWFMQATAIFSELGDPKMVAWADFHNGQLLLWQGRLGEAEQQHREALTLRERHGLKGFAAESRVALAAVALEQNQPLTAETWSRAAAEQFAQEQQADNEAWALALLAEALARQGRTTEAQRAMSRAQRLAASCQNMIVGLYVQRKSLVPDLNPARPRSQLELRRELAAALTTAAAFGLVGEQLELRLLQQTILREEADKKESKERIREVAQEATQHGLLLLAKRANEFNSQ